MRAITRLSICRLVPLLLFGCETPPTTPTCKGVECRQTGRAGRHRHELGGRGLHAAGRPGQSADVFCGTWQQPVPASASGGAGTAGDLPRSPPPVRGAAASTTGSVASRRYATTILGGNPAELMQCTQRVGGWPHVAMVALVNGTSGMPTACCPPRR